MSIHVLDLRGVDPLLFRDGRPFTEELGAQAAVSLPAPFPGVVAGAVRTMIGTRLGWNWTDGDVRQAKRISVAGPVICLGGKPLVHAPADAVIYDAGTGDGGRRRMALRPSPLFEGEGCNLPEGMDPVAVPEDVKPASGHDFWEWDDITQWLMRDDARQSELLPQDFPRIPKPSIEERTHVKIGDRGAAAEGMLFTTASVAPMERRRDGRWQDPLPWSYRVRVDESGIADGVSLAGPVFLGGERRAGVSVVKDASSWPACPRELSAKLRGARRIRMVLVTPAIFSGGWKPGWAGGSPPGLVGLALTLKAACVPRREAVSGWDYQTRKPKPVRWLAPAGSVYFFEADGDTSQLASYRAWLAPVSDNEQDRLDGYGLAVWGIW